MTAVYTNVGQANHNTHQQAYQPQTPPPHQTYQHHHHYYNTRVVPVQAGNISPLDRTIALVMSAGWFVGISGLQRFYAGKIWTGLLWFFTGGVFGIGQLIDVILICSGQFRDSKGRRIKLWTNENFTMFQAHPEQAPPASPKVDGRPAGVAASRPKTEWKRPALGIASVVTLGVAVLAGVMASLNLTELYQGGAFAGGFDADMQSVLGTQWPVLSTILLWITSGIGLVAGAAGVSLARAKSGLMHVGRSVASTAMLGGAVLLVNRGIDAVDMSTVGVRWATDRIPAAMELFFNQVEPAPMIVATLLGIGAVTLMGWPNQVKAVESESKPKVEEEKKSDEVIA